MSKNPTDPTADLYSILNTLEKYRDYEGKFTFKICYPEFKGNGNGTCNEWKQSSNPANESIITDFEAINTPLPWNLDGNGGPWGGLGKNAREGDQSRTLIDDVPTNQNYWMSIGAFSATSTSGSGNNTIRRMLGPRFTFGSRSVTKVELFVKGNQNFSCCSLMLNNKFRCKVS